MAIRKNIEWELSSLENIYNERDLSKLKVVLKDTFNPIHCLLQPLPLGNRLRTIMTRTERYRNIVLLHTILPNKYSLCCCHLSEYSYEILTTMSCDIRDPTMFIYV